MGLPFIPSARIGAYIVKQTLMGKKRYPLVMMLEPLFRCNLACAGCGKIDYPDEILNQRLSYDQCMAAIDECGAPAVSIAGGEPLLHRDLPRIVEGFIKRKKFVILCTNALLLTKKISDQVAKHARETNFGSVTVVEKAGEQAAPRNSGKSASKSPVKTVDVILRYNFPGAGLTDDALRTLILLVLDSGARIRDTLTS